MSRISDIILRARDTLADPTGDRWSDDRLLRLIDEAQKDICRRAKLLRAKATLIVLEGKSIYQMPEDLLLLTRVLIDDKKIDFIDHEKLDELNETWETEIGKIEYIVLDRRNRHILKTYRIPSVSAENEYEFNDNFGIISNLTDFEFTSDFGILGNIVESGFEESIDDYGIIYDMYESDSITIYYIKKPSNIALITDELEIDSSFDMAIKYYVVGKALRDDMDTQNRVVGNEELQFYTRELNEAMKDDLYDFVRTGKNHIVKYTGAF